MKRDYAIATAVLLELYDPLPKEMAQEEFEVPDEFEVNTALPSHLDREEDYLL